MLSKDTCGFCLITTLPHGTFVIRFRNCFPPSSGLSKVAGCRQKLPPTWLVSAGYSAWHFFTDDIFKIKYPWTGHLLWQLSCPLQNFVTTLHCDQFAFGGKQSIHNLLEEFKQKIHFLFEQMVEANKKVCLRTSKQWLILSDSVRCFENFWSLRWCFDLFVDKHKCVFSLVEKCRVTSWPCP